MSKKTLKSRKQGGNKTAYDCVVEELLVLKMLKHPNIIFLHEIIDDAHRDELYLVTEYHSRGSLADLLKVKNKPFEKLN